MASAAMLALFPDGPAVRGDIDVRMPAAETEGVHGVIAQLLTLVTGAAATRFLRSRRAFCTTAAAEIFKRVRYKCDRFPPSGQRRGSFGGTQFEFHSGTVSFA